MMNATREKTRLWLLILVGVVATLLGQTHAREIFAPSPHESGVFATQTQASTGENYDGIQYDALDSLLAAKRVTTPVGELRDAKLKDAHHVIQDAAVRDLPGYNTNAAPGVQLQGPANVPGTPHQLTRPVQRQAGGGTYAAERRIGYKALRKAGVDKADARQAIGEADDYFQSIGVTPSTPLRIPGDRR